MTTAQDQQSRAELLPCPFCGGAPETTGPWEIGVSDNYETCICCEKCGFHISSDDGFASGEKQSLAKAIDRWNRRAPAEQAARALPAGDPAAWMSSEDDHYQGTSADWQVSGDKRANDDIALYTAAQVHAMGRVPPGWQAVPVEPTSKQVVLMAGAILHQQHGTGDTRHPCWPQAVEQAEKAYRAAIGFAPRPPAAQEVPSGVLDAIRAAGMQLLKGVDGFKLEKAVTASGLNAGSAAQEGKTMACACGDEFPIDSYGAGFLDAKGKCFGCDAADEAAQERKPLTDEQIAEIASTPCAVVGSYVHTFARAIEAAHGIKETGHGQQT